MSGKKRRGVSKKKEGGDGKALAITGLGFIQTKTQRRKLDRYDIMGSKFVELSDPRGKKGQKLGSKKGKKVGGETKIMLASNFCEAVLRSLTQA